MEYINFSSQESIKNVMDPNARGLKFGEKVHYISDVSELEDSKAQFVLFGIPDIADRSGDDYSSQFQMVLKGLLNIQNNQFNRGENVIILGEIDAFSIEKEVSKLESNSEKINLKNKLYERTISELIQAISKSGKTPIAIGGNHKKTLDILDGLTTSTNAPVNLLDLSSHIHLFVEHYIQDLNHLFESNILKKYYVLGLHKSNATQLELDFIASTKKVDYLMFEDCMHLTTLDKCIKFKNAVDFLNRNLGFSLDLKSVLGMSSSRESISAFSVRDVRTFIKIIRKEHVGFFHIHGIETSQIQKLSDVLSYLISDFIRED